MQYPKNLSHPKYRPDIDGLRAVAVLLVVFFHVGIGRGGFIGVDIFFVISGFLISTIIFSNLDSGNFSFVQFYSRRIKRIFPALITVLIFSLTAGWFILFADEYKELGKHIIGGVGFVSNFLLLNESGYFDSEAHTKPLLHLWSLAVEEQFYIIWPLLLWAAWQKKFNLLKITIVIAAISFALSVNQVYHNKTLAFYSPQTRFWELLIGSILSYITLYRQNFPRLNIYLQKIISSNRLCNITSIFGAVLIIAGVAIITRDKAFPGAWALLPTIGTALIIFSGQQAWFNKILQNKILVWFGLISFPLYLWHWPLLSLARIIESEKPSILIRIIAVLVSIILAWLTYRFIEKPIRFSEKVSVKILIGLMLLVGVGGYVCYQKDGLPLRESIKNYQHNNDDLMIPLNTRESDGSCNSYLGIEADKNIVCLTNSSQPEFLIIGDSHAMSLNSAAHLNKVNLKTLLIAAHDCLPFEKYSQPSKNNCKQVAIQAKIMARQIKSIKTIIINNYSPDDKGFADLNLQNDQNPNSQQTSQDMFVDGYKDLILDLMATGKNVIFLIDNPRLNHDPKRCLARPLRPNPDDCKMSKKLILENQKTYREKIVEIKKLVPNLQIFDSLKIFCDEDVCYGKDSQNIFYFDKHHLNISGSKKLLNGFLIPTT